jgi:hypothetical protein
MVKANVSLSSLMINASVLLKSFGNVSATTGYALGIHPGYFVSALLSSILIKMSAN